MIGGIIAAAIYRLSFIETQKPSLKTGYLAGGNLVRLAIHEIVEGEKFPKPLQRSRIIYDRENSVLNYRVDFALISHDFCSINFASVLSEWDCVQPEELHQ